MCMEKKRMMMVKKCIFASFQPINRRFTLKFLKKMNQPWVFKYKSI